MIKYNLECDKDHQFAGWFQSSAAFDQQAKRKLVDCPTCGSTEIRKALMAPNVTTSRKSSEVAEKSRNEIMSTLRQIRKKVEESAEYVGPRFAEEARRMHYKETEEKGIYGEASLDEARALSEEGIDILPLPTLPEDQN